MSAVASPGLPGWRCCPTVVRVDVDFDTRAEKLLCGPRGRALCAAGAGLDAHRLLSALSRPVSGAVLASIEKANADLPNWPPPGWAELKRQDPARPPEVDEIIAHHVADVDLGALAVLDDIGLLLPVLAEAVNDWAFCDDAVEAAVVLEEGTKALAPVAAALARAPGAAWWWSPAPLGAQRWVAWGDNDPGPPQLTGVIDALGDWSAKEAASEDRAAGMVPFPPGPHDPRYSGIWWTPPRAIGLVGTTRSLPGLPAVQLAICEDFPGNGPVEVWGCAVDPSARIYEVDGPAAWCGLVEAYPREVTLSRRHDWWRWTGWEGRWLIPDWVEVAARYDGVHLSVAGHLEASYRALPVDGRACTCIAGWDPDETIWLTDVFTGAALASYWEDGIGTNLVSRRPRPWMNERS